MGERTTFSAVLCVASVLCAVAAACGEVADAGSHPLGAPNGGSDSSSGSVDAAASDSTTDGSVVIADMDARADAAADANTDATSDPPIVTFPASAPRVFGYELADAFPGTFLSGAMAVQWPRGSLQPFVLQRGGEIVRLLGAGQRTVVLTFTAQVALRAEAGAVGMALHPKFNDAMNPMPYVYVYYTYEGDPTKQRISRFTWDGTSFPLVSEYVLIEQTEGSPEHNGANLRFGPDGFLYFGNGDDIVPDTNAQRIDGGLFSGIFRIDVDMRGGAVSHAPPRQPTGAVTQGYYVPNDNPFVGVANANEEFYALGFRNPYSLSFDRMTGELWQADVGDTFREEINRIVSGGNYAWPFFEGDLRRRAGAPTLGTLRTPVYAYSHASIADLSAIMGGYVYRGATLPELGGKYIYSDWPTGRVWALDPAGAAPVRSTLLEDGRLQPVGWTEDESGELYFVSWNKIAKLVRSTTLLGVPKKLSDTHVFRDLASLTPSSSLVPYAIRSPLWSDGASKQRWVKIPPTATATIAADGTLSMPAGSLLVKHFELPVDAQPALRTRRLETRLLVVGADTYGLTYRWNAAGTDADLVIEPIDETIVDTGALPARTWRFPSFGDCWQCHRSENRVLGFTPAQLNLLLPDGSRQLDVFVAKRVLDAPSVANAPAPLVAPSDISAPIEDRASAYLAANCAPCHHPGAEFLGGPTWNAQAGVPAANRGLLDVATSNYPMAAALGLGGSPLVAPGDPDHSLLLARMRSTNPDLRMPPLLRTNVDPIGVAVVQAWIASLAMPHFRPRRSTHQPPLALRAIDAHASSVRGAGTLKRAKSRSSVRIVPTPCSRHTATSCASKARLPRTAPSR